MPARSIYCTSLMALTSLGLCLPASAQAPPAPRFSISFSEARSQQPIDGRLLLLLSSDPSAEPRFQIDDSVRTQMVFGMDVDDMRPGQAVMFDASANGYPVRRLREVKPGEYYVQVVLHRYETFHRADGYKVKLPMDRGEGQHWNLAPGNLYSTPRKVAVGASSNVIAIDLDKEIPSDSASSRHALHPAPQDSEQTPQRLLGTPNVPQRERAGAGRF